jgi:RNA polymerase sigma-70 factor (ECF subfamily)
VSPSDHDLVRAALGGSERAFRQLVERYERGVLGLVMRIVLNREDAEDVAQEAFVKAFTKLDTFDPAYKFSNWLFKIAHNTALDALRRRGAEPSVAPAAWSADAEDDPLARLPDDRAPAPDEAAADAEFRGDVERALGRLRPEYRKVIVLRHLEGMAYEDIADVLELPLGTVKTSLFRARRELAALLPQHMPGAAEARAAAAREEAVGEPPGASVRPSAGGPSRAGPPGRAAPGAPPVRPAAGRAARGRPAGRETSDPPST